MKCLQSDKSYGNAAHKAIIVSLVFIWLFIAGSQCSNLSANIMGLHEHSSVEYAAILWSDLNLTNYESRLQIFQLEHLIARRRVASNLFVGGMLTGRPRKFF